MNRRSFIRKTAGTSGFLFIPAAFLTKSRKTPSDITDIQELSDTSDLFQAPDNPELWEKWRISLHEWRNRKWQELKYDGSSYLNEDFRWVSEDFACCFVMTCDSDFYDPLTHSYRIKDLINRGKTEYGGYDSVVLWHAYPRIGLDDRNQFDFYRDMPSGLHGLRNVVDEFHKEGIKVFIDYNPWDKGTRREKREDIDLLIEIIGDLNADGIFLDTLRNAPGFREKIDNERRGTVLEGEIALPLEDISTHHMSWAQWFSDSRVPGVYRNKWFERHHMQHAIARWDKDKSAVLQTAWMNGSGILIWENAFGQLLRWNERDKSVYRTMYRIQHHFASLFSGEKWTPLSDRSPIPGVYISSWEGEGCILWTMVNRNNESAEGIILKRKSIDNVRTFDLIRGEEILTGNEKGSLTLKGKITARGIGCFVAIVKDNVKKDFKYFLTGQRKLFRSASENTDYPSVTIKRNAQQSVIHPVLPEGMVMIPAASITMNVEYTFREPGGYGDISDHLKLAETHKLHSLCKIERKADIGRIAVDITPVTNRQFKVFIDQSGYKPVVPDNYLKHWKDGVIPPGKEDHPVVYIDLDDARAYAKWAGKRLPTEEEWQYAAQGPEALVFPWGNTFADGKCNQHRDGTTTPVGTFPGGSSPFGCFDMCGNTWELTGNEYSDGRTRFVMLKGGSCYLASGSEWYFDGGPQKNSFIAKMLLTSPGLDRCATVGFRCASDL
jgi:formylglycine-generating enzyme required for sulfatase activity